MPSTFLRALAAMLALAALPLSACKPAAEAGKPAVAIADAAAPAPIAPALIPAPAALQVGEGEFVVDRSTRVHAVGDAAQRVARQLDAWLIAAKRPGLPIDDDAKAAGGIRFALVAGGATSPEAYSFDAKPDGIVVSAADERGLFYGAVTLWQLLTQGEGGRVALPALRIEDTPRFAWRGLMLDSARHFQSVADIEKLLDAMALHKLNTFHWHLTDDQGWRIEIRKYPKLAEVGGCRVEAGDAGVDPATGQPARYCGFYTQEQIRDVVAYAAARHIEVVPEIDVPGHATAAIAAYPQLGVSGQALPVSNEWGVNVNLFNAEEGTFEFLENVLAEVVELFPGRYVHIGGDEAVKDQWIASARVQQRMRELGAKDETAMQALLVARLEKFLSAHGKRLIGWDEILDGELPAEATVMSWRGTDGGIAAANQGHDVVMAPSSDLYFDYLQTDSANEPPGRPATIDLKKVYGFEPVPSALPAERQNHILGLQANVWTEHMRTFARVQHAIFPRIAALAEAGWSPPSKKDYADFLARLPAQVRRYRALGIGYAQTPFEVAFDVDADRRSGAATVALSDRLGYPDIRYTTDGSEPTAASPAYAAPLKLKLPAKLRAAAFADGHALADATALNLDAAALSSRSDEQLAMCTNSLMLRLEDDRPFAGDRAVYDVDIFNPCWEWKRADLDGVAAVEVRAGRIPYFFQLAHDEPNRKFQPAKTANGELAIRAGCDGAELASVPLPAQPDADGFVTLKAAIPAQAKPVDLCVYFTGDTRPAMWVLDRMTLLPAR